MDIDRDHVLAAARHERDALGRTVQYTPPDHWEAESPREGWRVKDVLAHLAASDVVAAALLADEEPVEVEEYRKALDGEPFRAEGLERWSVERRADAAPVSLGLEWGRAADLVLTRGGKASDPEWHEKQVPWIAGDIRVKYLVQARVSEWWVHGEDVREGARLPPRREHWPVYLVNDLAVRLIPYSLSLSDESRPGKVIRLALQGVGEGVWLASTDAGRDVPEGALPDAYLEGDGYAFASVAGGRADVDVCLYEGLLRTGGDTELAESVLRTLRSAP
jgi:uncharacterized protein (TIGR03083 family)